MPSPVPTVEPQFTVSPFERVRVYFVPEGGSRIEWDVGPRFTDPFPHTFQLQTAHTDEPDDTWVDVGTPADNTYYLADDTQRTWSKTEDVYYRVQLTTMLGTYLSVAVSGLTYHDYRTWRLTREMLRRERKRLGKYTGTPGWLLRRRRYGPICPDCTDPLTGGVINSSCQTCWGEGILGGYFVAVPCTCDLAPEAAREQLDLQALGTTKPVEVEGNRFSGFPQPVSKDVFVEAGSGKRWFAEMIRVSGQLRGYPFVSRVTLRLAPFSDIIYQVPLT